jgi:hypothetical protein
MSKLAIKHDTRHTTKVKAGRRMLSMRLSIISCLRLAYPAVDATRRTKSKPLPRLSSPFPGNASSPGSMLPSKIPTMLPCLALPCPALLHRGYTLQSQSSPSSGLSSDSRLTDASLARKKQAELRQYAPRCMIDIPSNLLHRHWPRPPNAR